MTKPTTKKRSKLIMLLLAPALFFVFMIGWTLYYIGQRNTKHPQKPKAKTHIKQESVKLMVIPKQEEETLQTA